MIVWILTIVVVALLLGGLVARATRRKPKEVAWYEELWERREE